MLKASGWPRMETAQKLVPTFEPTARRALPLQYLYSCLTFLDDQPLQSPVGDYTAFLLDLGQQRASELMLSDVFTFLQRAAGVDAKQHRVIFILIDEVKSCIGQFPGSLVSFHLKLTDARTPARGSKIVISKINGLHERSHVCLQPDSFLAINCA